MGHHGPEGLARAAGTTSEANTDEDLPIHIHIHGTGSSIVDTVFVCRATGQTRRRWLFDAPPALARILALDLAQFARAGRVPTLGDTRCIAFGHLTRIAIWNRRQGWDPGRTMREKLARFAEALARLGPVEEVLNLLEREKVAEATPPLYAAATPRTQEPFDAISF